MKKLLLVPIALLGFGQLMAQSVVCGNGPNPYSILRTSQNQVIANSAMNSVIFIHRQDPSIHGEPAANIGKYRFGISTDGGNTFTQNVGPLNPNMTRQGRYPNVVLYNPPGNTTITNSYMVWTGPTLQPSGTGWDGHVNGVSKVDLSTITGSENYQFQGSKSGLPGGLTERVPGEFWLVENPIVNDTNQTDTLYVYKGIYNTGNNTVAWTRHLTVPLNPYLGYDGTGRAFQPNISFSPNGQIGWIALVGDLVGGDDTLYQPILIKTTDGGASWGTPFELQINTVDGVLDSMQALLFDDGQGGIIQVTEAACAFDFDITVDANGNPHFFCVMCTAEAEDINTSANFVDKQYSVYPAFPKFACDVTSTDGGSTWTSIYLAPVNSFRTTLGTLLIDNQPQVSRNDAGTHIFYSWVDTDTLITGPTNDNTTPNLIVAGYRISDGFQTCYQPVRNIDIADQVIAPTMAPNVLQSFTTYELPIVGVEILTDETGPVIFHYLGNSSRFCEEDFNDPANYNFQWSFDPTSCYSAVFCNFSGIEEPTTLNEISVYPNPATETVNVSLSNVKGNVNNITITNLLGEVVMSHAGSSISAGQTLVTLNVQDLAAGIYNVNVNLDNSSISKKITIIK